MDLNRIASSRAHYSVHTSAEALRQAEMEIRRIAQQRRSNRTIQ